MTELEKALHKFYSLYKERINELSNFHDECFDCIKSAASYEDRKMFRLLNTKLDEVWSALDRRIEELEENQEE